MRLKLLIFIGLLIFIAIYAIYQTFLFSDKNFHVIFCDVGQGDAIFMTTPGGYQVLFDGGPDEKVLDCLSRHMPFWDRSIDLVFLSHPHDDHLVGLITVIENYTIGRFLTEDIRNETESFKRLEKVLQDKKIPMRHLTSGDIFKTPDTISLAVLGPTKDYLERTSPGGIVGETREFGNLILHIKYGTFDVLLTGDSQAQGLKEAVARSSIGDLEILQVLHHGSKTGLNSELVELLKPDLAVISVGKNSYGHPAPSIINLLQKNRIQFELTREKGDVEVVSNGKGFTRR